MAAIIISPILYCFNVSMMSMKEIYAGNFWPKQVMLENYTKALQLAPFFYFYQELFDRIRYRYTGTDRNWCLGCLCFLHDEI